MDINSREERKESLKKAIQDKSIAENTLKIMIDFYVAKGSDYLLEEDKTELLALLNPLETPAE